MNINKINQEYRLHKLIALLFVLIFCFLFPKIQNSVNSQFELIYLRTFGSAEVDTNIVIIKIDENTINSLSGWPIKRSYYALAINYLKALEAKKIGIEVLLANTNSATSIYNNLLVDEIKKNDNVVFASLLTNIKITDNYYSSDSVILPEFNQKDFNFVSGHINYIENAGYFLPVNVRVQNKLLEPFSLVLSSRKYSESQMSYRIKINKSWRDYKNIELIQFLKLFEQNPKELAFIKNKIVLIGVTDEMISKNIEGVFDYRIPGVGFHAICVDNLLNDEYLTTNLEFPISVFLFIVLLSTVFINFGKREVYFNFLIAAGALFIGLIFYQLNILLNYSMFVAPSIILFIISVMIYFYKQKTEMLSTISEVKILNQILQAKESELKKLQENISTQDEINKKLYEEKIHKLNSEIDALKNSELNKKEEIIIQPENDCQNFEGIIFRSAEMRKVVELIKRVAPQNVTVLIQGESGTGKELVAHAIHNLSPRKNEKFIAINCAALSESILESELFGHVKGAFTNAISDRKGHFEAADKGTIFLDEIGETSENFQTKLLRVLQFGEVQKVGSTETIHVDVRVIAATNKNLIELVNKKQFREDLFFRLNVIQIAIPPLKNRAEDIPCLADYFAKNENPGVKLSNLVYKQLVEYDWRGNVRELQSTIKRAVIFAISDNRDYVKLSDLPENFKKLNKSDLEKLILDSLRQKNFSHTSVIETAKELGGINRNVVSEHLRGIFFRTYVASNFDLEKTIMEISGSESEEIQSKVKSKCETYIQNIRQDLVKLDSDNFEEIKMKFESKYRNLPQKYHEYLDELIKFLIK